jgi:hypothetical protein
MDVFQPQPPRGSDLLLVHCAAVATDGPTAYHRLEQELGGELARLLVFALVGPQGRRALAA